MNRSLLTLGVSALLTMGAQAQLYWQTNGTSGIWTDPVWGSSASGPFTSPWAANTDVVFTANSAGTFATTSIGNVTVADGATVTITQGGTLSTNSLVRTFDIGTGATLTWTGQAVSNNSTSGFIKNGAGTWNIGAQGNAYTGGFTLNAGKVIATGNNSFGTAALTINGGTVESTGTRAFAPTSLVIGGNFAFSGTGNANWDLATTIDLGASTRTITNSTTSGSRQLRGLISGGAGVGLTFDGTGAAQIYIGNTGNTFSGPVTVTGGEVVFNDNGAFGATTSITIDGGRVTLASMATGGASSALTAGTIASSRNIFVGATAGTSISVQGATGVVTYDGVIADKIGSTGSWAKQGGGRLDLGGVSTFTGSVSLNNGTVRLTTGNDRLPIGATINLGQAASTNTGTLDLNGFNQQIAGLNTTPGGTALFKNTVTSATSAVLTLSGSGTYSYGTPDSVNMSGVLTGAVSVVKNGSGSQTLGDMNTYTGGTTINDGTLATVAATSLGTGPVTLNGGLLTTGGGVTLALGDDFTITGGSLTLFSLGAGQLSLASDKDFIMSSGVWNLSIASPSSFDSISGSGAASAFTIGGGTLDLTGSVLTVGDYDILTGFGAGSGAFATITGYDNSQFNVTFDTSTPGVGKLQVAAVPEPSAVALAIVGLMVLLSRFPSRPALARSPIAR